MCTNTDASTSYEDRLPLRWAVIGAIAIGIASVSGMSAGFTAGLLQPQLGVPVGVGTGAVALLTAVCRLNQIIGK